MMRNLVCLTCFVLCVSVVSAVDPIVVAWDDADATTVLADDMTWSITTEVAAGTAIILGDDNKFCDDNDYGFSGGYLAAPDNDLIARVQQKQVPDDNKIKFTIDYSGPGVITLTGFHVDAVLHGAGAVDDFRVLVLKNSIDPNDAVQWGSDILIPSSPVMTSGDYFDYDFFAAAGQEVVLVSGDSATVEIVCFGGSAHAFKWTHFDHAAITGVVQTPYPSNPFPSVGSEGHSVTTDLTWNGGYTEASWELYLSTDSDKVLTRDASALVDTGVLTDPHTYTATWDLGVTYYWRVVSIDGSSAEFESPVWSFTMINDEVLSDMEDSISGWSGGANTAITQVVDPQNENNQVLEMVTTAAGSTTFDIPAVLQDLTASGGAELEIGYKGVSTNSPATVSVTLTDTGAVSETVYPVASTNYVIAAETIEPFRTMHIDLLNDFSTVDLTDVDTITISIDAAATIYIDNVIWGGPKCHEDQAPANIDAIPAVADPDYKQCWTDMVDFHALARDWQETTPGIVTADSSFDPFDPDQPNLMVYYAFDDASGSITLTDSTSYGRDGTFIGDPNSYPDGKLGGCFKFESIYAQRVDVPLIVLMPQSTVDDPGVGGAFDQPLNPEITVSVWIKETDTPGDIFNYGNMVVINDWYPGVMRAATNNKADGSFDVHLTNVQGSTHNYDWDNSVWSHHCLVNDGPNGIMKYYLDGELVDISYRSWEIMANAWAHKISIGAGFNGTVSFLNGKVDEFRVYDRALTQAEVLVLADKASIVQPLVSVADIDGDADVDLTDMSILVSDWLDDYVVWPN